MSCFLSVLYQTLPTLTGDPYESDEDDTFYPNQSSSSEDEQNDEEDSQYDYIFYV